MSSYFGITLTPEQKKAVDESLYNQAIRLMERIRELGMLRMSLPVEQKPVIEKTLEELLWMLDKVGREMKILDR